MSDVKPVSGRRRAVKNRPRVVRSGMSVCLALAVIYSFGYPGSTPLTSGVGVTGAVTSGMDGSSRPILAQGSGLSADAGLPHTGYVGAQVLGQPSQWFPFGTTDSLVPGRDLPVPAASGRSAGENVSRIAQVTGGMERPGKGMLISPLQFLSPSSPFGLRTSPITGEHDEFHSGQDFAAPCGTRVFSADAGVVRAVGWHPWGGGNRVELDHGNGLVTTYNHLEGIAVKTGDRVGAGQVIATIGTSGLSTGCHLHFETILDGEHTNPAAWKLIPLENSGPAEMPALVNFTPGTGDGKDGNTAWVAYLASAEAIHPVAVKSPSRVDADMAAQGPRSTTQSTAAGSGNQPTASGRPSSSVTVASTPSPSPSGTKSGAPSTTTSPKPKTSTPGTSSSTPTTTTAPPSKAPGSAASTPATPTPPPSTATDPTPAPPAADPTPVPPVTDPAPPPVVTAPEPTPVVVVPDPAPTTPVTDPAPTTPVTDPAPTTPVTDPAPADPAVPATPPTVSVNDPLAACDPAVDPDAIVVDPVTGEPVLDPVTAEPIRAAQLCASATASNGPVATGTEPAREVGPALVPAP